METTPHTKHFTNGLLEIAIKSKDFRWLIPYPCLLFSYQAKTMSENHHIATIASHMYVKNHMYCGDKCGIISLWLYKVLGKQLTLLLKQRVTEIDQPGLFLDK